MGNTPVTAVRLSEAARANVETIIKRGEADSISAAVHVALATQANLEPRIRRIERLLGKIAKD